MIPRPIPLAPPANPYERFMAALPGWLLLGGGIALLAMALLTPAWLALRDLDWQHHVMEAQLGQLLGQQQRYAEFLAAIESEDPVLIEHLAYTQLRLTPVGKNLLESAGDGGEKATTRATSGGGGGGDASVAQWLYQPLPRVGEDIAPLPPLNSRLTRLTRGPMGVLLCVAALTCAAAGVFWRGRVEGPRITRPWLD